LFTIFAQISEFYSGSQTNTERNENKIVKGVPRMATLQEKLAEQLPKNQQEIRQLIKDHGDKVMSEVTVAQAFGGMRGVKGLICDTSLVEPDKGLIIRGIPILDLVDKLPEEIFYLLLTGELPDAAALRALQDDLRDRQEVPQYVWSVLDAMSGDAHPQYGCTGHAEKFLVRTAVQGGDF
jgi:hypothetical protein